MENINKPPSAADIANLCDRWRNEAILPDGAIQLGGASEHYRLLNNSVKFHELNHEELSTAIVGLTKVLLHPNLNLVIDEDHLMLWAWCGQLFFSRPNLLFTKAQQDIEKLYKLVIHTALANYHIPKPTLTKDEWQQQCAAKALLPHSHHAAHVVDNNLLILSYLAFPLLEAVIKKACASYVSVNGKVIQAFSVAKKSGGRTDYGIGSQCSNLRNLLYLHQSKVASLTLTAKINQICESLQNLDQDKLPFDLIFDWRNDSLHGTANFVSIGATILNLALIISLFEIEQGFDEYCKELYIHSMRMQKFSIRSENSFYPPG